MANTDHTPDWRLAVVFGAVLVAAVAGPAIWTWAMADRLPDEVARHWGAAGGVTGVWSLNVQLVVLGGMTLVISGVMGATAVFGRMPLAIRRMLVGCAVWLATLLAAIQIGGLAGHLDINDPFDAPAPFAGFAVGIPLGLVVAFLVGRAARDTGTQARATAPPPADLPRVPPGEPMVDRVNAPTNRALTVVAGVIVLATAITSLFAVHWPVLIGLAVFFVIHLHTRFVVTITDEEVRVANRVWTMLTIPIAEIAAADATTVDPFWEFGGWGLRVDVAGRTGIVIRKGVALLLRRGDDSEILITIDDPERAVATINTYADRRFGSTNA